MTKRLLPLVGALLLPIALATVNITATIYPTQVPSAEYPFSLLIYAKNTTPVNETYIKALIFVYKEPNEELVYYSERTIVSDVQELVEGVIKKYTLYPIEWSEHDDGIYLVKVRITGYTIENGSINNINEEVLSKYVTIGPTDERMNIDLLSVAPNLTNLVLDKKVYTVYVTIRNDGILDIDDARACLEVYDTYGTPIEKYCTRYFTLASGETKTVTLTLDATKLEYGNEYIVKITVEGAGQKETRTYKVRVRYPDKIIISGFDYSPLIVKPGDYVLLRFYVKNEYNKTIVLTPVVISYDLNLYRELDSVTIEPFGTKEIKAVIKVPKSYKEPVINVFLKLRYDGSVINYAGKVYVKVERPVVDVTLIGPKTIEKEGKLTLRITNLEEDIKHLAIDAYLEDGIVMVKPSEIVLGGKGDTKEVEIKVEGYRPGLKKLYIYVKDVETGKTYANITKELNFVIKEEKKETTLPTVPPQYLLAGAAIVIAAAAVYLALRGPKEEKPT